MIKPQKILHIFAFKNIYCTFFQKFVEENYDTSLHQFVYLHQEDTGFSEKWNYWKSLRLDIQNADKIIIHFLPTGPDLFFWFVNRKALSKSIWVMWGRDLFYPIVKKGGLNKWFIESLRKILIPKIGRVIGDPSDYVFLKQYYQIAPPFNLIFYPLPGFNFEEKLSFEDGKPPFQILLGNSADPSNRHILTLDLIAKYKDDPITIYCPLSYGGTTDYIEKVCEKGREIFGEKFKPLLEYLPIETYTEILTNTDIGIMNHERQQGLGNIRTLLFQGKKVFMSSKKTPFKFYTQDLNFSIEDAQAIEEIDFEQFSQMSLETKNRNHELFKQHFGLGNLTQLWDSVFQS